MLLARISVLEHSAGGAYTNRLMGNTFIHLRRSARHRAADSVLSTWIQLAA
jgi:hypothetical protein